MQLLSRPAAWLSLIILILGAVLSLAGLLIEDIYSGNSLSLAAQARGQDLVTLCIAVPARLTRDIPVLLSSPKALLRACAVLLLFVGGAVLAMWLAQLLPALSGGSARVLEESGGKPVIQALDLGVFVPAAVTAAVLVFRGRPTGVVWVAVLLVKGLTLALAVVSMTLFMDRAGTPDWGGAVIFSLFSLLFLGAMIWLFSALKITPGRSLMPGAEACQGEI